MGPMEVLLIIIVALIIWGPGKLPEIARTLGRIMRNLRKVTSDLTTAVTKELDVENELKSQSSSSDDKTKESSDKRPEESRPPEEASPRDE